MNKKTVLVATVFGLFVMLTACQKKKADLIVGNWQFDKMELSDSIKKTMSPEDEAQFSAMQGMLKDFKAEFTKDGNYTVSVMQQSEKGTYSIDEKTSKFKTKSAATPQSFLNDSKIIKLDEKELVVGDENSTSTFKKIEAAK